MTVYTAAVTSQKSGPGSGLSVSISAAGDDAPHVTISLTGETRQVPVCQLWWWGSLRPLGRCYPPLWWSSPDPIWSRASQARPGSRHHSNWLLSDYLLQPGSMRNVLPKNDLNSGPLQPTARQGGAQADQGPLHLRWDNSSWQTIPGSKFKYKIKSGIFGRFVS